MKFFHIRPKPENKGRGPATTIGYTRTENNQLLFTVARCSENDVWNRKKSIMICEGRLRKGVKLSTITVPEGKKLPEVLIQLAETHEQAIQAKRQELRIKA